MKFNEAKFREKIQWSPETPKRHEPQLKILEAVDKVVNNEIDYNQVVITAGTRFGKSALCGYICVREILKNVIAIRNGENVKPIHIWIVAPTYDLADKVFDYVVRFFAQAFPDWARHVSRRIPQSIKLPFGIKIECKSGDSPEGMLGEEIDLAIVDECSRLKRSAWESYLAQRLGSREGKVIFISTPFGKNWFYEQWIKAKEYGTAFQFTTKDNPYYPEREWQRAKETLPEAVFQQEHQALFLSDAAAVFRGIDNIILDKCLKSPEKGHLYYMGLDLAKHRDYTVITIIDSSVYPNKVVYADRFQKIDYPFQKKRAIAAAKRYNNARIVVDSTAVGEPISDELRRESGCYVEDFKFTNQSKKELIEKLSIMIEQKKIFIPNWDILVDELKAFGYMMTDAGNIRYSAPEGLHDDCVISLALACWKLRGRKTGEAEALIFDSPNYV